MNEREMFLIETGSCIRKVQLSEYRLLTVKNKASKHARAHSKDNIQ